MNNIFKRVSTLANISTSIVISMCISGCATIFSGSTQKINIKVSEPGSSEPLTGISCTVLDPNGSHIVLLSNPSTINVSRGEGAIQISCKKEGYHQLNMAVGDSFNAVTIVNVLFWPGFIVDAVSGSYKKYPSHYLVTMEKNKGNIQK